MEHPYQANVTLHRFAYPPRRSVKRKGGGRPPAIVSWLKFTLKAFGKNKSEAARDVRDQISQDYPTWIITGLNLTDRG
jgi:hypothetical protein